MQKLEFLPAGDELDTPLPVEMEQLIAGSTLSAGASVSSAVAADGARQPDAVQQHALHWLIGYRRSLIVTDLVVVVVVVLTSQAFRIAAATRVILDGFGSASYWLVSALVSASWLAALAVNGAWDRKILGNGPSEYGRILRASFYLFGFVAILSYLAKAEVARSYLLVALPLGVLGLCGGRWARRRLLAEYRRSGSHMSAVLVVGGTNSSVALATRLRAQPAAGFRVAGLCIPGGPAAWTGQPGAAGFTVVGDLDDVVGAIGRCGANVVAVAASESFGSEEIRALAWKLEGSGTAIALVPALTDVAGPRIHVRPVAGLPLVYVEEPVFRGPRLIAKTLLDYAVAMALIVILSPVVFAIAIAIKMGDRGPVFFRQERVGLAGATFRVWKFRSMRDGADKTFQEARATANQDNSVFYKSATDSRITAVGGFLRRTSLDEIPQLLNVLCRQMSIVGPRPLVPGEGAEVGHFLERRMLMRPGITGLWQVSGRSDVTPEERIRLDFYYIENWSVASDFVIMARTARTVLSGRGAY
ncbi:MAG: sugar transferase [Nakamurella sp.]